MNNAQIFNTLTIEKVRNAATNEDWILKYDWNSS